MSDAKEQAKAKKKQAKEQVKAAKKQAKVEEKMPRVPPAAAPATTLTDDGPSPAERSAQAAEKQVRLQHLRVWFAFFTVLLTLAALLITIKPWRWLDKEPAATDQPAAVSTEAP